MFRFNIQETEPKENPVQFANIDIGSTFMYYSAYQDSGLDSKENYVYVKVDFDKALCLNGPHQGNRCSIYAVTVVIEVDLEITNITLKEEK